MKKKYSAQQEIHPELGQYLALIRKYESKFSNWQKRAKKIVQRYRDDQIDVQENAEGGRWGRSRYNILWSNIQTAFPSYYSQMPIVMCERRNKERDPVGRVAAEMVERLGKALIYDNDHAFDMVMRYSVLDMLLPGRGQAWVEYKAEFGEPIVNSEQQPIGPDGMPLPEGVEPIRQKVSETIIPKYVYWSDYGHNLCRNYQEETVRWRKTFLTKKQAKERFPDKAAVLKFNCYDGEVGKKADESDEGQACVFELWDKQKKEVFWFCDEYKTDFLDRQPDTHELVSFFPCPRPIYASLASDSLVPIPDFAQYSYQADVLDELHARRRLIIKAIRVVGARNAANEDLSKVLADALENELIPVQGWTGFQQQGGLAAAIEVLPLKQFIEVLTVLDDAIRKEEEKIYQISGMSDIMRGYADPRETATSVNARAQFSSRRLGARQQDVQRFARDLIEIMVDMALKHFDDETIIEMVDLFELPEEDQAVAPQALELLRNDRRRRFKLTIETDSTLLADENAQKAAGQEFLETVGTYMQSTAAAVQQMPDFAVVALEMLSYGSRLFRAGRSLEGIMDSAIEKLKERFEAPEEPQAEQPDPAAIEQQARESERQAMDAQMRQYELTMKESLESARIQLEQMRLQQEGELKRYEIETKAQLEREKAAIEAELEQRRREEERMKSILGAA